MNGFNLKVLLQYFREILKKKIRLELLNLRQSNFELNYSQKLIKRLSIQLIDFNSLMK